MNRSLPIAFLLLLADSVVLVSGQPLVAPFTKVTTGSIVTELGNWQAGAWGDYDGDGFLDIFVTSAYNPVNNTPQKNVLYHNNRDGTFTKVTNTVLTIEARDWRGSAWADYDNNGTLDLFVVSTSNTGKFSSQNELFRNNGDGTFTKMTPIDVGDIVSLAAGDSEGPIWGDYDNDGFLDLFIARYGEDWLFHNNGDGTFSHTSNALTPDSLDSYSAIWGDFNNDGYLDLFVANNLQHAPAPNSLFLNNRDGTFTKVASGAIATDLQASITCAAADYDNDGNLDIIVGNPDSACALYHNNGDGTFSRMTTNMVGPLVAQGTGIFTFAWGDYDNDGFIDLFASVPGNPGKNRLYHNNGDGTFTQVVSGSVVNDASTAPSIGCAWVDYDNDGFLDLFVARGGDVQPATNLLYHNNGNTNSWLKLKLIGLASNRSAIGAKVRVKATVRGRPLEQLRQVSGGSGFLPTPLDLHFGLGDAEVIDAIRIEWPSGIVQTLTNVPAKQTLSVTEHQENATGPVRLSAVARGTGGATHLWASTEPALRVVFETSSNLATWVRLGTRTNLTGMVEFIDSRAVNQDYRFYRAIVP